MNYRWLGWKRTNLIPTDSPDYKEIDKYNSILVNKEFIKTKELKIGATYLDKNNNEMIYMGTFLLDNFTSSYIIYFTIIRSCFI